MNPRAYYESLIKSMPMGAERAVLRVVISRAARMGLSIREYEVKYRGGE